MDKINLFKDALPNQLFRRLARAVQAVGTERMEDMGSYNTTFWFPIGAKPTNIVEECITKLYALVGPGPKCIGMEWWLGRLKFGEALPFHTDRDRSLRHETGQIVHPMWSSILYLNRLPGRQGRIVPQLDDEQSEYGRARSFFASSAMRRRTFPNAVNTALPSRSMDSVGCLCGKNSRIW